MTSFAWLSVLEEEGSLICFSTWSDSKGKFVILRYINSTNFIDCSSRRAKYHINTDDLTYKVLCNNIIFLCSCMEVVGGFGLLLGNPSGSKPVFFFYVFIECSLLWRHGVNNKHTKWINDTIHRPVIQLVYCGKTNAFDKTTHPSGPVRKTWSCLWMLFNKIYTWYNSSITFTKKKNTHTHVRTHTYTHTHHLPLLTAEWPWSTVLASG